MQGKDPAHNTITPPPKSINFKNKIKTDECPSQRQEELAI